MNDRLEFAHDENNTKEWFLHKTADKDVYKRQQLFIPACIATVRHFPGNGDIMLLVDTEKILSFLTELTVTLPHGIYLVCLLYTSRCV